MEADDSTIFLGIGDYLNTEYEFHYQNLNSKFRLMGEFASTTAVPFIARILMQVVHRRSNSIGTKFVSSANLHAKR
ncbi:hypothetical protein PsorP6_007492 [Peronosclerospora sorghi]|uniref:Uncharacterized protein n=1 Tax=Peronosclerospora sorghi TaxID=230839 RepID=A0ACC0WA55_9STRA|nr:hypothetical protein PsorP6_007492 [Peronosclerospora sorghi]